MPATFTVMDGGDSGGGTQLRAIWETARANGVDDTINFDSGVNLVTLTSALNTYTENAKLTIIGNGKTVTTIAQSAANARLFNFAVAAATPVIEFSDLKLANGNVTSGFGGAILNDNEIMSLTNVHFAGNTAVSGGGALSVANGSSSLTITGCDFTSNTATSTSPSSNTGGGAVHLGGATTVAINGSVFDGNRAVSGSSLFASSSIKFNSDSTSFKNGVSTGSSLNSGGAMFFQSGSSTVAITNATVTGNTTARRGGMLYVYSSGSNISVSNSTISGNSANDSGGAIRVFSASTVTLTNSTFGNNSAGAAGGAVNTGGVLSVTKSTFSGNTSASAGGGVYATGATTVTTSIFTNNRVGGATGGGALRVGTGSHTIQFSQFTENTATSGPAGALLTGGGTITVNNSTFSRNSAGSNGGAISHGSTSTLTVNQSTFNKNVAQTGGGAVATTTTGAVVINNATIYANTANTIGGGGLLRSVGNSTTGLNLISTIVANNTVVNSVGSFDIFSSAATVSVAGTKNLIGTNEASSIAFTNAAQNQLGTNASRINAKLGALVDNGGEAARVLPDGGFVKTMALAWNSPALNQGLLNGFSNDQRGAGFARDDGNGVDVGAFEGVSLIPIATLASAPTVLAAGNASYSFDVAYDDNSGFDTTSFDNNDVTVTGAGFGVGQNPTSFSIAGSGQSFTVTYTVPAPSGGWGGLNASNTFNLGNYSISLNANQVIDDAANAAPTDGLGTFRTAFATTIVVSSSADTDDGNHSFGQLTFREALNLANDNSGFSDSITFDASVFTSPTTITLTAGPRIISDSVTISGPAAALTFDAATTIQRFSLLAGKALSISKLSFTRFSASTDGGVLSVAGGGSVTLSDTSFSGNTVSGGGGVLNAFGAASVTINNCSFSSHSVSGSGAVLRFSSSGASTVNVVNSTFTGNRASSTAGVLYASNLASVTVSNSTFTGNTAGTGGAINANSTTSTVTLTNSTFINNGSFAGSGGVAQLIGTASVTLSTFSGNTASISGGALYFGTLATNATVSRSVFSGNAALVVGTGGGGAIRVGTSGNLIVNYSDFANNFAASLGGAIHNSGSSAVSLTSSTFRGNSAASNGGALLHSGSGAVIVNQSTFTKNTAAGAAGGGAIAMTSTGGVTLNNSTLFDNVASGSSTASNGGGIVRTSTNAITLVSSIVAGNKVTGSGTGGIDLFSTATVNLGATTKFNLIGTNSNSNVAFTDVTTNQLGATGSEINPLMGALDDYGGEFTLPDGVSHVMTLPLQKASPALDKGDANGFSFDQRGSGFARVVNGGFANQADVGAFEGTTSQPTAALSSAPTINAAGNTSYSFDIAYTDDSGFDTTTFDTDDVLVTGNGFGGGQKASAVNIAGAGTSYTVTYTIPAPTGGWGGPNVGAYSVTLNGSQVADDATNFVKSGSLGSFKTNFATALTVDQKSDTDDGIYVAGQLSFREALKIANGNTGFTNTIGFDGSVFNASTTISVTGPALPISNSVEITGPSTALTFDAGNTNKQFVVNAPLVSISKLNFSGFSASTSGGVMTFTAANATITLTNMGFSGNKSGIGSGGALSFAGSTATISIANSSFATNSASGFGGAISFTGTGGSLTINNTGISNNTAAIGSGGGLSYSSNTVTLVNSTVTGNSSGNHGGGVYASSITSSISFTNTSVTHNRTNPSTGVGGGWGNKSAGTPTVTVANSTFSGNTASRGGGLYFFNGGKLTVSRSTFSGNTATSATNGGAGLYLFANSAGSSWTIQNSTIANNTATAAPGGGMFTGGTSLTSITFSSNILASNKGSTTATNDINSTVTLLGNGNLVGIIGSAALSGSFNQNGVATAPLDPLLLPLANNGGATQTHGLAVNSPAFDQGTANGFTTDQRGLTPTVDLAQIANASDGTDVGAFEYQFIAPIAAAGTNPDVTTSGGTSYQYQVIYTDDFGVDTTTIDTNDVTINGPGYGSPQSPTGVVVTGSGTSVTATYTFAAPGGTFDFADNGTYTVTLAGSQVADIDGPTNVAAGNVGTFKVNIAAPANPPTATVTIDNGTGQRSMIRTIVVTFSEAVTLGANPFTVTRLASSSIPTPNGDVSLSVAGAGSSYTISFNDPTFAPVAAAKSLIDGKYTVTLNATDITSTGSGQQLDGNGDTTAGDSQVTAFHRLFGDVLGASTVDFTANGFTDNVDLLAFRAANGSDSTMVNYNAALDVNGDGFIDNIDLIAFRARLGTTP